MEKLLKEIISCTVCKKFLPDKPRTILRTGIHSKIVIIGQAPWQKVQDSCIPWDELRRWPSLSKERFYDEKLFALVPMDFCNPGKSSSGDLSPRLECATLWHQPVLSKMKRYILSSWSGNIPLQVNLNHHLNSGNRKSGFH